MLSCAACFVAQVMDPADADKYYFDPLDCTKVWPTDLVPVRPVGKMVLDTNIDNFFAEAEQIAFCPAITVPGEGGGGWGRGGGECATKPSQQNIVCQPAQP